MPLHSPSAVSSEPSFEICARPMPTLCHPTRTIVPVLCLLAVAGLSALGAQVTYIDKLPGDSYTRQQVETAAKFYGLEVVVAALRDGKDRVAAIKAIRDEKTLAVIVTANALAALDEPQVLSAAHKDGRHTPLLIAGITGTTDPALLMRWSGGAITGCRESAISPGTGSYAIGNVTSITRQLGGSVLPLNQREVCYLTFASGRGAQWLTAVTSASVDLPVFASGTRGDREVFFATASDPPNIPVGPDPYREPAVFAALAPEILFLRYAAGERGWHSPGHYANLTIDDAWLREPFGHVNYEGLLREMDRHNFHTTLAFVPWNFDRSQPALVSLFRTRQDRFSICLHGNNHDGQEFGSYEKRPLSEQANDVEQGLARMARFTQLTQVPFDPVMVFPHSVAPEGTLAVLKRYNFAATVNSENVPLGAVTPSDPEFALRPATLVFSNFPSVRRYSDEAPIPASQLAIDAFLGNPLLFYVHQNFFAPGISAFDKLADTVNQLQADTQWRSLGVIATHLYFEKVRDDGNIDVRAYSGTLHLDNSYKRDVTFFVEKEEDFALPVTVFVDGQPYPYQRAGTRLHVELPVREGTSREITVKYENGVNLAAVDISKTSWRVAAIRWLSDFRDDVVSRTALGRRFIQSYEKSRSAWNRSLALFAGLLAIAVASGYVRRSRKRLIPQPPPGAVSGPST